MSTRLSRGRSTPEIRATLTLLYPCRCLCRGFEQITRITPRRRMTLQRSQIFFTDGWTFIEPRLSHRGCRSRFRARFSSPSFVPVHDPAACQVVRRQLHQHPVPREDPDVVHPHLPRDVSQNVVPVFELHPEHGVGERLGDRSLDLDGVLLRQALPSVPRRRTGPIAHGRAKTAPERGRAHSIRAPPSIRPWRASRAGPLESPLPADPWPWSTSLI